MTVSAIIDPGDIDSSGHWYGARMCCLNCKWHVALKAQGSSKLWTVELICGLCGEVFGEYTL